MADIADMIFSTAAGPKAVDYMTQYMDRAAAAKAEQEAAGQQRQLRELQIQGAQREAEDDVANQPLKKAQREEALRQLRQKRIDDMYESGNTVGAIEEAKKSGILPPEAVLTEVEQEGIKYNAISIPGQKPTILDPVERKEARATSRKVKELEAKADYAEKALMAKQQFQMERDLLDDEQKRLLQERELAARKEIQDKKNAAKGSSGGVSFSPPVAGPASRELTSSYLKNIDSPLEPGKKLLPQIAAGGQLGDLNKLLTEQALWAAKKSGAKGSNIPPLTQSEALAVLTKAALSPDTVKKNPTEWFKFGAADDTVSLDMEAIRERVVKARKELLGEVEQPSLMDKVEKVRALPGWEDATDEDIMKALQEVTPAT